MLAYEPHPLLLPAALVTRFPAPLLGVDGAGLGPLLQLDAEAPVARDEARRQAVRDLLRHGGHKPKGRGKPSSEYLVRAATEGALGPINPAVDAGNGVSLASGIPISVIDLDRATLPLTVRICEEGGYVFNPSGQELSVAGLLCLCDAEGPCANAVKDAQRTKTHEDTQLTLSVLWGPSACAEAVEATLAWYREVLGALGAHTERVA